MPCNYIINVDGLVGYWGFNEGTGTTAVDSSSNGYNGTISGASWTTGIFGSALSFDGINDKIALSGFSMVGEDSFSVSAWVNAPGTNGAGCCG